MVTINLLCQPGNVKNAETLKLLMKVIGDALGLEKEPTPDVEHRVQVVEEQGLLICQ